MQCITFTKQKNRPSIAETVYNWSGNFCCLHFLQPVDHLIAGFAGFLL